MKRIIAFVISILPTNFLRIFFYKIILKYEIDYSSNIGLFSIIISKNVKINNSNIGIFNILEVREINIKDSKILNFNKIIKFKSLKFLDQSYIGNYNKIYGLSLESGTLEMTKAQFSTSHEIQIYNNLKISCDVVFGGINSQINFGKSDKDTVIGKNVYFGSSIKLNSGIIICEKVVVGAGSILHSDINNSGLYVSSKLKKI